MTTEKEMEKVENICGYLLDEVTLALLGGVDLDGTDHNNVVEEE